MTPAALNSQRLAMFDDSHGIFADSNTVTRFNLVGSACSLESSDRVVAAEIVGLRHKRKSHY
jgi:hypothetical protein